MLGAHFAKYCQIKWKFCIEVVRIPLHHYFNCSRNRLGSLNSPKYDLHVRYDVVDRKISDCHGKAMNAHRISKIIHLHRALPKNIKTSANTKPITKLVCSNITRPPFTFKGSHECSDRCFFILCLNNPTFF